MTFPDPSTWSSPVPVPAPAPEASLQLQRTNAQVALVCAAEVVPGYYPEYGDSAEEQERRRGSTAAQIMDMADSFLDWLREKEGQGSGEGSLAP